MPVLTDGEQGNRASPPTPRGVDTLAPDGAVIPFADGHARQPPRLTGGPFRYGTFAVSYLTKAKQLTDLPVKQPVIAPSASSLLYPAGGIDGYPREKFLAGLLPELFRLRAGSFYQQLASEPAPERVLAIVRDHSRADQRIVVGVTDPVDPGVETPEDVRDRVLLAARYIPVDRLGTCDDCGFSPFADDTSTSREIAFAKIEAQVRGTALAAAELGV